MTKQTLKQQKMIKPKHKRFLFSFLSSSVRCYSWFMFGKLHLILILRISKTGK